MTMLQMPCDPNLYLWHLQELHRWLPRHLDPAEQDVWVITQGNDARLKPPYEGLGRWPVARRHVCIISYALVQKMPPELLAR